MNLNVLSTANYRKNVFVWEDLDFNLRISGLRRTEGGGTEKLTKEEALAQPSGGAWLTAAGPDSHGSPLCPNDLPVIDSADDEGPAVICKCYRFEYIQDQATAKKGGCAGDVLHADADDGDETKADEVDLMEVDPPGAPHPFEKSEKLQALETELENLMNEKAALELQLESGEFEVVDRLSAVHDTIPILQKQCDEQFKAESDAAKAAAQAAKEAAERAAEEKARQEAAERAAEEKARQEAARAAKDAAAKLVAQKQAALEACRQIWRGASETDKPGIIKQMKTLVEERAAAEASLQELATAESVGAVGSSSAS